MNTLLIIVGVLLVVLFFYVLSFHTEGFDIPLRSSSAWDWNIGPGYGAGYGTGYAMWGMWPDSIPTEPWKNWMWGRRPLLFRTPFTPVPQIDYNAAPDEISKPESNYYISLLPVNGGVALSVNGFTNQTLQLDRNRDYFFHVYAPGAGFVIKDDANNIFDPVDKGTIHLRFDNNDSSKLYYEIPGDKQSGGVIYLNNTRWV